MWEIATNGEARRLLREHGGAVPEAHAKKVAELEELRKRLDPFQLSLEAHLARLANRRLSPKAEQQTMPETAQQTRRANGPGKPAALGNPANYAGFPLSHSSNNNKLSLTFPMSRPPATVTGAPLLDTS